VVSRLNPILAAVRSSVRQISDQPTSAEPSPAFITISREAGAGGRTLMRGLVERLNELDPPATGQSPWSGYDKDLVEKVSQDHNLHKALVGLLGEQCHSWLYDVFAGMSSQTTESEVYRRVAETIRGLAQGGRAVIVGRGGALITRNMPRGVHVQLVAPFEYRVEQLARSLGCDQKHAASEARRIDQNRASFYKRYWPGSPLSPSLFTVTFNSAAMAEQTMVEAILPLVPGLHTEAREVVTRKVVVK
jgi:cytidylate kinase